MDNIALAQRLINAGHADDWQPLVDHLADDVVFKVTIPEGTPIQSVIHGKQAVVEHLMNMDDLIEFRQLKPEEFFGDGDRVVILGEESYEIKKTGETVPLSEYATIFDFRDGLITRFLIIQDMSAFADAYRSD